MFEGIVGLLLFWPFIIGITVFLIICVLIEDEHIAKPGILIIAFIGLLWLTDQWSIIDYAKANFTDLLINCSSYIGIGVAYATFKWYLKVKDKKEKYDELLLEFAKRFPTYFTNGKLNTDAGTIDEFKKFLSHNGYRCVGNSVVPQIRRHKEAFSCWIVYWPCSLLSNIINDTLKAIFNRMKNVLQMISNKVFGDIPEELR